MTTEVLTAQASDTVATAASRMQERRVGSVVVTNHGAVVGILTERDLVRLAAAGADASSATVSEAPRMAPAA